MRRQTLLIVFACWICWVTQTSYAQEHDQYATIDGNCAVTLVGDFPELRGVQARSTLPNQFSLDTREINGIGTVALTTPFLIGGSSGIGSNIIGLIGPEYDANDETPTSILYTGTYENADDGQLTFEVSTSKGTQPLAFVAGPAENYAQCAAIEPGIIVGARSFSGILGGVASDEQFASIVDGAVTINGTFERFSGIEVRAEQSGLISLQTIDIEGIGTVSLNTPFESGRTIVRDDVIVLGAVGSENQLEISQSQVKTAILYNGNDPAADLRVQFGRGAEVMQLPFGGETGSVDGNFVIEDGFVTLVGDFSRLSGIEVHSSSGNLFMDTAAGGGPLTAPFDAAAAILFDEFDGKRITLGVDTAGDRIDAQNTIRTSIRYDGTNEEALSDLSLTIGIAGLGAVPLSHADVVVPEPHNTHALALAGFVLLASTSRRQRD